jgi:hypothetical protein
MDLPTVEVQVVVQSAEAVIDGVSTHTLPADMDIKEFINWLKHEYRGHKIKVDVKSVPKMEAGTSVDQETGEIHKIKRNWITRKLDSRIMAIAGQKMSEDRLSPLRGYETTYIALNVLTGVLFALLGKTTLGMLAIGLSASLLIDVATIKSRRKFYLRNFEAITSDEPKWKIWKRTA